MAYRESKTSAEEVVPDTIFALSSAPGRAGVAVVRVSGRRAGCALDRLAGGRGDPRVGRLRQIRGADGRLIDRALTLWFPAPASFTGEDVAEFQVHGSRAVVAKLFDELAALEGLRPAQAGEFAMRAFRNGKLDLAQAEGLADLIDAETEAQREQALNQAEGVLSGQAEAWRVALIETMALVEAAIDFSDEADVAADAISQAEGRAAGLLAELDACLADGHRGEIVRDGFRVALVGPPNAGKSSLMNAFARRDVAIVSDEAGTTRDVIEVRLDIEGHPVIVSDTAGIREAEGSIEREGIRRTLAAVERANLVIWLDEPSREFDEWPSGLEVLAVPLKRDNVLRVVSKADQITEEERGEVAASARLVSSETSEGMSDLVAAIGAAARASLDVGGSGTALITQARHRYHIEACRRHLNAFFESAEGDVELRAEDLRKAAFELGRITGRVDVEDVLDQVFGRFCIGK